MSVSRLLAWGVAFVGGLVFGVAGTISQSARIGGWWVGLGVALLAITALLISVRSLTEDRWAALATGMGLMIATLVLSGAGPGGSVVVPQPPEGEISSGQIWTIALPIIVALVVAWPSARASARPTTN